MIKRDKKKEKLKAEKREAWKKDLLVDVRTESRVEGTGKKVGQRQRVSLRIVGRGGRSCEERTGWGLYWG